MTEQIGRWIYSVATVTMIMAVITVITPKNTAGRAAMLCASIAFTAVLVSPIKAFDVSGLSEYERNFRSEIDGKSKEIEVQSLQARENIIEENLRAYILQRAKQFGISCDAEVQCIDGTPRFVAVVLRNEKDREKVSEILLEECGIEKENQSFEVRK